MSYISILSAGCVKTSDVEIDVQVMYTFTQNLPIWQYGSLNSSVYWSFQGITI